PVDLELAEGRNEPVPGGQKAERGAQDSWAPPREKRGEDDRREKSEKGKSRGQREIECFPKPQAQQERSDCNGITCNGPADRSGQGTGQGRHLPYPADILR